MKRFLPYLALLAAALLTIVGGVVHGRLSNRWGPPADVQAAAAALAGVPDQIGPWQKESDEKLSPQIEKMLECVGHVQRTYRNRQTHNRVNVAILLGPPGPIAVHTPEICYSSQDYTIIEQPHRITVGLGRVPAEPAALSHTLWATTFRSNDLEGGLLRVYHGWSDGGAWTAPDKPRFTMADRPYLYKIQLAGYLPAGAAPQDEQDSGRVFLEQFLPAVAGHLVSPPDK
jgi:hypothetical protein